MKNKLKEMKGITLIALVITIIVLLILAGVSIAMLTGENGILTQATNAKEKTQEAEADEMFKHIANEWQIEKRKTGADLKTFLDDKKEEGKLTSEATYNEADKTYTLEYNGEKVKIDNNGALTEVAENEETVALEAGAYYTDGSFKSWEQLVEERVTDQDILSSNAFYGDDTVEKIIIPDTVTYFDVDSIYECQNLSFVSVPNTLTYISGIDDCPCLSEIEYRGTLAEFEKIEIDGGAWFGQELIVHCTDGDVTLVPEE